MLSDNPLSYSVVWVQCANPSIKVSNLCVCVCARAPCKPIDEYPYCTYGRECQLALSYQWRLADAGITEEVNCRIPKAFGSLRQPLFQKSNLSLITKRTVYQAAVLSVLLYRAETWTLKLLHARRFHNWCMRTILGLSRYLQWQDQLTTGNLT